MTVRGYPFDTTDPAGSVTELEWRRLMRWIMQTGVVLAQLNEFAVAQRAAGANMSVEVATGEAFIVGHYVRSDAVESKSIAANATGDDRIDLVVVGFDFVANSADVYVKQGAAGGPVAPVPTEDITTLWEVALAEVLVAAGENVSIVDADISDVRTIVTSPTIDATSGLAAGDLFYLDASGLLVPLPLGDPLDVLKVNAGQTAPEWAADGSAKVVRKSADESVTSSTAFQDDNELLFAVAANEQWAFRFVTFVEGDAAGDIAFGVSAPAGATGRHGVIGPVSGVGLSGDATFDGRGTNSGASETAANGLAGASAVVIIIEGSIENGANAGNVTLRWAQNASSGTATTVKEHSFLVAQKVV